jgi:anti-sigma regulatory factor (Ser/Thr protein kinase)
MWWCFAAADAAEAEWLRPAFIQYLRRRGREDDDYAGAELIFGELIANVIRHAPGEITVRVDWEENGNALLSVTDGGPGFVLRHVARADPFAEDGRGLFLISAFGQALHVRRAAGGGCCVSVQLPVVRRRLSSSKAASLA